MKKILLLSDTHSFIDDQILKFVKQADEVFISNSVIGIQSVKSIEGDSLGDNPLTEVIKAAFKGKTQDIKSWTCF